MDYRKLLEYYLTSDEWEILVGSFFEEWKHCYDPYEDHFDSEHGKIYLHSSIYFDYQKRLREGGGAYFDLYLTEAQFERFFDEKYSPEHRFAVLFGMWWRLTEEQIRTLALPQNKRCCRQLLNYYLCNPSAARRPSMAELESFDYAGEYVAQIVENGQASRFVPVKEIRPDGSSLLEID